jgi:hypothetical protein
MMHTGQPLFLQETGIAHVDENMIVYRSPCSVIVRYIGFISNYMNHAETFITIINTSVAELYLKALSGIRKEMFHNNRVIIDVSDDLRNCIMLTNKQIVMRGARETGEWLRENGYCYEQVVKPAQAMEKFQVMLKDLDVFFGRLYGITGRLEKRKTRCHALIRTSKAISFAASNEMPGILEEPGCFKLTNLPLRRLVDSLNKNYMARSPLPVVDGTRYMDNVNLEIRADMSDPEDLNRALAPYHLRLIETVKELDMVVIREKH